MILLNMRTLLILTVGVLLPAGAREWVSADGRKIEAEFMRVEGEAVWVRTTDGEQRALPKAMLAAGEWETAAELQLVAEKAGVLERGTVTAKTSAMSREEFTSWETSWGSYNKTIDQSRVVQVAVRSRSALSCEAVVEVIWLGNGSEGKGPPTGIAGITRFQVPMKPGEEKTFKIPQSYTRDDDLYRALGVRFQSGTGYAGWVARVSDADSGQIWETVGSRPPLTRWAERVPVSGADE